MCRDARRLELSALDEQPDGSVDAEVTCTSCGEAFTVAMAPSPTSGSAFSEHLALVATTFVLAFANRQLRARRALAAIG